MNRFWKFLGIFGSICSIIGLYLAFFFYNQTKETREPFFIESPIKSKLIETKNIEKAPFKIYRYDNTEINNDVTSTTLYLWNQGKKPIKSTDILDSLLISLPDSCEILKIEIIGQTRDVCNISLIQINKNQVKLNFNIIEHLDGFIAQLIYIGNSNQNLRNNGKSVARLCRGDSLNQTGRQVVRRSLNIQPTLTIRPGFPVRVIVNRDLVLEPYKG